MVGSNNSGAGVHTIIFALETILYNSEEQQKIITPRSFGKTMKGWSLHDKRKTLTRGELIAYRNQLMNAYDYWKNKEWKATLKKNNSFRLIFEKRNDRDKGVRS